MALINLNPSTDYGSQSHQSTNHEEPQQQQESVMQYCEYCVLKRMNPMFQCHCQTVSCLATNNVLGPVTVLQDLADANNSNSSSNNKQRQNPQSESALTTTATTTTISDINGNSNNNSDGFVGSELRLMKNLILLSFTSSIALGIVQTLITIDRYIYGPWTYIGYSVAFMLSALSVYYAQAFVTRFGPNKTLTLSTVSIVLFVLVHYSSSFILFQFGAIIFALFMGPFYAAQLEFISTFISNLIYLTATIKRHQEERYQKLLHLLLFCPSRIVGHLIYVIIFILLTSSIDETTNNHHLQQPQQHQQQRHHPQPQQPNHSKVAAYYNEHQISTIKPLCQRIFRQQYCDQALYYVFTFHRNIKPTLTSSSSSSSSSSSWALFLPSYYYQTFQPNFIMILITVFILLTLVILTMVMFLIQRIEYYQIPLDPLERSHLTGSIRNVMFRTFHDNHLRLLLPMAFFIGLEQGFFMSDYNKLYVSCALGLKAIGFIMLTMGFVHLATTLLVHEFIRHIQRPLVLLAGSCCQLAVLVILCLWRPNDDLPLYYVITICWALSNAILETLLLTNILRTFCADEWKYAFLTLYSMHYLGSGAAFAMSEFICLYIKLYLLIFLLILALIPMKICELRLAKFQKILGPGSASHL